MASPVNPGGSHVHAPGKKIGNTATPGKDANGFVTRVKTEVYEMPDGSIQYRDAKTGVVFRTDHPPKISNGAPTGTPTQFEQQVSHQQSVDNARRQHGAAPTGSITTGQQIANSIHQTTTAINDTINKYAPHTPTTATGVHNPADHSPNPIHTTADQVSQQTTSYGGETGVVKHTFSDGTSTYVKNGHIIGRETASGESVPVVITQNGGGGGGAPSSGAPSATPAAAGPQRDITSSGAGYGDTTKPAQVYSGGNGVAKSFVNPTTGVRTDIMDSGAVIQTAPGGTAHRAGWVDTDKIAGYDSAADLKGQLGTGTTNPFGPGGSAPAGASPATGLQRDITSSGPGYGIGGSATPTPTPTPTPPPSSSPTVTEPGQGQGQGQGNGGGGDGGGGPVVVEANSVMGSSPVAVAPATPTPTPTPAPNFWENAAANDQAGTTGGGVTNPMGGTAASQDQLPPAGLEAADPNTHVGGNAL